MEWVNHPSATRHPKGVSTRTWEDELGRAGASGPAASRRSAGQMTSRSMDGLFSEPGTPTGGRRAQIVSSVPEALTHVLTERSLRFLNYFSMTRRGASNGNTLNPKRN